MGVNDPIQNKTKWIKISSKPIFSQDENDVIEVVAIFSEIEPPLDKGD